jgi:hypothetical protein
MNMNSMAQMLAQLQASGVNVVTPSLNPDWPLMNEKYEQLKPNNPVIEVRPSDSEKVSDTANESSVYHPGENIFIHPKFAEFQLQALGLYNLLFDKRKCVQACQALVTKSHDQCAEVHNVLALQADTLEDALEEFRKARTIGDQTINWRDSDVKEAIGNKCYWGLPPLRVYQRAQTGVAQTLCKLKRYVLI